MAHWIQQILNLAKTVVFERGHLVYWLNIPGFRRASRKVKSSPRRDKARVGFVMQMPNNWAASQSVYDALKRDPGMEVVVLLMPEVEFSHYVKMEKIIWEKNYAFGREKFGEEAVELYNPETGKWLDPKELRLDYVFYTRPYETYLPREYRASAMKKICRTCYNPYTSPLIGDHPLVYNMHFIRNLYMIFCEKEHSYRYVTRRLRRTISSGDQKVFLSGFPKFDLNWNMEGVESPVWPRPRQAGRLRILWTPRWTTDPRLCSTNFFKFKDDMISWVESDHDIDFIFRPHPMGIPHWISTGLMTQQQVDEYLGRFAACENATVDKNPGYFDTFWSSDILITDMSSVMQDYMLTGRPIIFCPSPLGRRMSDDPKFEVKDFLPGMYIAHTFDEILQVVKKLAAGEDPLHGARMEIAEKLRRGGRNGQNVADEIHRDYFGA